MASYGIYVTDAGGGAWQMTTVMRAPTTATITGGVDLNTTTAGTGFRQAATTTSDGLGHVMHSPNEVLARCMALIADDRSYNGD